MGRQRANDVAAEAAAAENDSTAELTVEFNAHRGKNIEATFGMGDTLRKGKETFGHGSFETWVEETLGIGKSKAERLMKVAADQRLRNPAHVPLLPNGWSVLVEIARLPDDAFNDFVADGTINPKMERADVTEAVRQRQMRIAQQYGRNFVASVSSIPAADQPDILRSLFLALIDNAWDPDDIARILENVVTSWRAGNDTSEDEEGESEGDLEDAA
jgi:hypothetical protein